LTLGWAHLSVVSNTEVAEMLQEVSDRYRSQGEEHRARVYSRAAVTVLKQDSPVKEMNEDELRGLKNVGSAIVEDINEFTDTGSSSRLQ
jgi:DNA polymerase/3'-5' exonuclease PolX